MGIAGSAHTPSRAPKAMQHTAKPARAHAAIALWAAPMKRTTGQDRSITRHWRPATQAVRGGTWRSEMGETSEALFLTSGYAYDDAATVAARFAGEAEGMAASEAR